MSENTILGSASDRGSHRPGDRPNREVPVSDPVTAFERGRLYSLLSLGFERPGAEVEAAIDANAFTQDLVTSAAIVSADLEPLGESVASLVASADELHPAWAALFGVEEGITVSPYQLTYLPGPLLTNIRQLADIKGFYRAFDLAVADGAQDRGDHLCFLTEFLSQLCLRESALRSEADHDGVAVVVEAQQDFLEDHLGRWYWRFADEVAQHDNGFYAAMADLLAALIEHEIDRLALEPRWVPDDPAVTEWNEDIFGDSGRGCGGCGFRVVEEPATGE